MFIWAMALLILSAIGFIGSLVFTIKHLMQVHLIRALLGIIGLVFFGFWSFVHLAGAVVFS